MKRAEVFFKDKPVKYRVALKEEVEKYGTQHNFEYLVKEIKENEGTLTITFHSKDPVVYRNIPYIIE